MAGVGKLLKQAQKMQKSIESLQTQMEAKIIDISRGRVAILSEAKLAQLAQFDDRYLHQSPDQ